MKLKFYIKADANQVSVATDRDKNNIFNGL